MTLLLLLLTLAAVSPVTLSLDRRLGFAPLSITVDVHIPRHIDNRAACVAIGGAKTENSCWQLEGDQEPRTVFTRYWLGLPAGRYVAGAWLERRTETIRTPLYEITVLGE